MSKKKRSGRTQPLAARHASRPNPLGPRPLRPVVVHSSNDACPVCGAETLEEGQIGCCGALVFTCSGSVGGVPAHELDEDDPRLDNVVMHSWYGDTGAPAPHEGSTEGEEIACRCERSG